LHLGKPLLFSFFGVNWGTMGIRRAERLRRTLFGKREIPEFNSGISEQLFLSLSFITVVPIDLEGGCSALDTSLFPILFFAARRSFVCSRL
jgi:hypothetical protein